MTEADFNDTNGDKKRERFEKLNGCVSRIYFSQKGMYCDDLPS